MQIKTVSCQQKTKIKIQNTASNHILHITVVKRDRFKLVCLQCRSVRGGTAEYIKENNQLKKKEAEILNEAQEVMKLFFFENHGIPLLISPKTYTV